MLVNKPINLSQLYSEMVTANVQVRGLGLDANDLHTYDENGGILALPPEAEPVVTAHVAVMPPTADQLAAQRKADAEAVLNDPTLTQDPVVRKALARLLGVT